MIKKPNDPNTIYITSGVNSKGKPFCQVEWGTKKAQLDPDDVRQMALDWLGAAEAAEHDAAVFNELREGMGLDLETAGAFIYVLRGRRLRRNVEKTATFSLGGVDEKDQT